MKRLLVIIFTPLIVQAQDPSLISTFEFGQKPFIVNELDISLTYLDESPSPDYFTTNFSLEPSSIVICIKTYLSIFNLGKDGHRKMMKSV